MRTKSGRQYSCACLRLKHWQAKICLVVIASLGIALPPWALGHSDLRMFGQIAPAIVPPPSAPTPASGAAQEVRLPAQIKGQETLFSLVKAQGSSQASAIRTYGLVVPNTQAMIDVNIGVSGQVANVYVRVGDSVRKGQPLVSVFNPEFITTQRGYLEFLKNEDKLQVLREEGRLPNYLKDAKENLRWWGMNDRQITDLIDHGKVVEHILLHAPTDGFVTELLVQPGSLVNAGDRTMKQFVVVGKAVARMVAARTPLWIEGYVYPDQRALLRPGLLVRMTLPDGRKLERPITQVFPMVDPATQRARFLLDMGQASTGVAVGQILNLTLELGNHAGIWVPRQAVLGQALSPVVYVQRAPGRYQRKPVAVLNETPTMLQVNGIVAGEQLVVSGKMMLEGLYRISAKPDANPGEHHDHH